MRKGGKNGFCVEFELVFMFLYLIDFFGRSKHSEIDENEELWRVKIVVCVSGQFDS